MLSSSAAIALSCSLPKEEILVAMNMEGDFHMARGGGENSYANNSRLQKKAMIETKPVLEEAVRKAYMARSHPTVTIVDLGCSASENTLLFVSNVMDAIGDCHCDKLGGGDDPVELQFFLNDLPSNDFNRVFQSLEQFKKSSSMVHKGGTIPFYITGVPSSYYTRLMPCQSVHLFHSSYCLHWRSRLPDGLDGKGKTNLNEENIYIVKTTPLPVVKLYQKQFQKDMLLFLKLRHQELVNGGQMVLTFLGRKDEDAYSGGTLDWLLARAVQSLVEKGLVEKEKLDSFNLPVYKPSINEVKEVVKQSEQFHINCLKLFESNWDPYDDSEGDGVHDNVLSGINVAKSLRAVMGPLFSSHFSESLIDEIFKLFASNVTEHLDKGKTGRYSVVVLSLGKL